MSSKKALAKKSKAKLDIEGVVANIRLRPIQFVHGAFLLSSIGISGMTFVSRPATTEPHGAGLVQLLSMLGMILWIGGYGLGMWLFGKRMKGATLLEVAKAPFRGPASLAAGATEADKIAHHIQRAWAMRLAAWSIGPIVSLLSVQAAIQGNLVSRDMSIAVTGVFPMVVFFAIAVMIFPTANRIRTLLEKALAD